MANIHPTAVVDGRAKIAADVEIGPFCVVEADAEIGAHCRLLSHAVVRSCTVIGENNTICEGAILGGLPQHIHAGGAVGGLRVGSGNTIREHATIHRALRPGTDTVVGDHNLIMVNAHIAHDCTIGSRTIITNNAMIAGHVAVEDRAYISGAAGVHQFCRVGQLAMVGGQSHLNKDVPPFVTVDGLSSRVVGLNLIGLRRAGYNDEEVLQLKAAYRLLYRSGLSWNEILDVFHREFTSGPASCYGEFLRKAERGIVQERRGPARPTLKIFAPEEEQAQPLAVRSAS